jgi:putative FmdB family regulatory protein
MSIKYICKKCGYEIEYHSDMTIPAPKKCPKCGEVFNE